MIPEYRYRDNPLIVPPLSVGSATSYISPGSSVQTTSEHNIFKKNLKEHKSYRLATDKKVKNIQNITKAIKSKLNDTIFSDAPEYTSEELSNALDKKAIAILKSYRLTPDERVKNIQDNSKAIKSKFVKVKKDINQVILRDMFDQYY